jgi:hypothetical protein
MEPVHHPTRAGPLYTAFVLHGGWAAGSGSACPAPERQIGLESAPFLAREHVAVRQNALRVESYLIQC